MQTHTLTTTQQNFLTTFCEMFDLGLRTDYSGRGMFGKSCVGFVLSPYVSQFMVGMELGRYLALTEEGAELATLIEGNSIDDTGKGKIIYFPNITWN